MDHLILDGYNIINAWSDIFNLKIMTLEECRDRLLHIMSDYQGYKNIKVMVVFDAHLVKGSQLKEEQFDNITVVYTKENETADNYIERFVYRMNDDYKIIVATSDYLEQTMVLSSGGVRMSARELKEEVLTTKKSMKQELLTNVEKLNTITTGADPKLVELLERMRRGKF
jgi:uncharacterized protein